MSLTGVVATVWPWASAVDLRMWGAAPTAIAVIVGAMIIATGVAGALRENARRTAALHRLDQLQRALAALDRVSALSYEIEDRYGRREGAADADIPAILALRRDMAMDMAAARALLETHGDLNEPTLAEDALLIAVRPVVESPPALGEGQRSLERLRSILVRLRFEAADLCEGIRRKLRYRPHGEGRRTPR